MSDNGEPLQPELLHIEAEYRGSEVIIVLEGEFDMTGTARFWTHIGEALAAAPRSITVDASGLDFIDSSGLMALLRARDAATKAGVAFRVGDPSPTLRLIVDLAGVADLLWAE